MNHRRMGAFAVLVALVTLSTGCGGDAGVASTAPDQTGAAIDASVAANDALAQEFVGLPTDAAITRLSGMETTVQLQLAHISGLEDELGGPAATATAFGDLAIERATALKAMADLQPEVAGFGARRIGGDAMEALAGGLFGLILLGETKHTNGLTQGESATLGSGGKVTLGHLSLDVPVKMEKDGLVMETRIVVELDLCPDGNGIATGTAHIEGSAIKGGAGQRITLDVKYEGQTDDDANLTSPRSDIRMQAAQFGNGVKQFVDVSGGVGLGHLTDQKTNRTGGDVTQKLIDETAALASVFGLLAWAFMLAQVEQAIESGRCVKLEPTVSAGPTGLDPGATVTINAAPRSKIDGEPTKGTVKATLTAGGASVAPAGTKEKADATFTYVAPDEKNKTGTVDLEARSKRGIARATLDFTTAASPPVAMKGNVTFSMMGMAGSATFDVTMVPGEDETYTGTAEVQLSGAFSSMATTCTAASWTESIDLMGTLTTENDEQVLVVSTTGDAPLGNPVPMTCTTAGVSVESTTPLISSTLFGELRVRVVDGDQPFTDTISPAKGTITVTLAS